MGLWLWLLVTPSHDAHCEHTGVQGSRGHFSSVLWEPLGSIFAKVRVKLSSFECFTKPSQEPGFNYSDKCIAESDVTGLRVSLCKIFIQKSGMTWIIINLLNDLLLSYSMFTV